MVELGTKIFFRQFENFFFRQFEIFFRQFENFFFGGKKQKILFQEKKNVARFFLIRKHFCG